MSRRRRACAWFRSASPVARAACTARRCSGRLAWRSDVSTTPYSPGGSMHALDVPVWAWSLLAIVMLVLIAIDLLAHRGDREDSRRGALIWTVVWIAAAL